MSGPESSERDPYETTLLEIGRIATTWAKYEYLIDRAIWQLMDVPHTTGACVTTQLGSIHAKHRAVAALIIENERPDEVMKRFGKIEARAHELVKIRNRYAHGPLNMGINFETREFEVYLENVSVKRAVNVSTDVLPLDTLKKAHTDITALLIELIEFWPDMVGREHIPAQ